MIVFIKEKLVILSAPKTGTTSLHAALESHASIMFRDPPGVKHINLGKYQRQIRKMLENLSDGPLKPLESFATRWIGWAAGIVIANVTN